MTNPNVQNIKSSVLLLALTKHTNDNKIEIMQPYFFYWKHYWNLYKL